MWAEYSPRPARSRRTKWYVGLGVLALAAVAGSAVVVNGDDQSPPDATAATTDSQPSVTQVVTIAPITAAPTLPPDTLPPETSTTELATTTTEPPTTTTTLPPVPMVDVIDATGSFVVQLPADFQTNVRPVTVGFVDMNQISGATDIALYLTGDFSVLGATVLAGVSAQVGTPADLLAKFDPGDACTLTNNEPALATGKGAATVLSYDNCAGGAYTMILLAVDVPDLQQIVFVGVQATGASTGAARTLALGILESFRPA